MIANWHGLTYIPDYWFTMILYLWAMLAIKRIRGLTVCVCVRVLISCPLRCEQAVNKFIIIFSFHVLEMK